MRTTKFSLFVGLIIISCWVYVPLVNSFRLSTITLSKSTNWYKLALFKESSIYDTAVRNARIRGLPNTALSFKVSEDDGNQVQIMPKKGQKFQQELEVEEEDADDDEDNDADDKNTKMLTKLSKGLIPIAATVGFAVTPSSSLGGRFAGAAAGSVVGFFAKQMIDEKLEEELEKKELEDPDVFYNVPVAIEEAVDTLRRAQTPIVQLDLKSLELIAKQHGIKSKHLGMYFVHVLAEAIYEATSPENLELFELGALFDFIIDIGFSSAEIADGLTLAAVMVGSDLKRTQDGFIDISKVVLQHLFQASKIFFLADKLLGTFDGFYGKRMLVSTSYFLPEDYQDLLTEACRAIYIQCVQSVISSPERFTSKDIEFIKDFLTTSPMASNFRPGEMQKLIMDGFLASVDKNIAVSEDRVAPTQTVATYHIGDMDKYRKAQSMLGWNDRELLETVRTKTTPVFETASKQLYEDLITHPDRAESLGQQLLQLMTSLQITPSYARQYLNTLIAKTNNEYMTQMLKVYALSDENLPATYKILVGYSHLYESIKTFTKEVYTTSTVYMGDDVKTKRESIPFPKIPFSDSIRFDMYQYGMETNAVVMEEALGVNPQVKEVVEKLVALPKILSWLQQNVKERNFHIDSKTAYRKQLDRYNVTTEEWESTAAEFYYEEVKRIAGQRAIPSNEDMEYLADLRDYLDCPMETVNIIHVDLLGQKFIRALEESMQPTGIIGEDYVDGLSRLRNRSQLSDQDSEDLLGVTLLKTLKPMVESLCDIFKSNTDMNYRFEKERKKQQEEQEEEASSGLTPKRDKSLDPISSTDNVFGFMEVDDESPASKNEKKTFLREVVNTVDFVVENYQAQGIDVTSRDILPINAVGIVNGTDLIGMYKHYLISRISEPSPELRKRYLDVEPTFTKLLGLELESTKLLKESVALSAYTGLIENALQKKAQIDRAEVQQFAILKEFLPLEDDAAEEIFQRANIEAVLNHCKKLFSENKDGAIVFTAPQAKQLREQVESIGLSWGEDLKFNEELRAYLFVMEVQYMVENGEDNFKDLADAYEIPEEAAVELIEATCQRYISQLLNLALRAAKKYDETETIHWTAEIMKYANYVTGGVKADGNVYDEEVKKRLISFFVTELENNEESDKLEGIPEGETAASMATEKLRELIQLSRDFVPPVYGIEGILGNSKSMNELLKAGNKASTMSSKKNWAWGLTLCDIEY